MPFFPPKKGVLLMNDDDLLPTKEEAENLLSWAYAQNPGPWAEHCRVAARAAEAIAKHCALDPDRAWISGLLHDIGRYEGVRGLHHVYAGYAFMREKGHAGIAQICLSHSFPFQHIGAYSGENDCAPEELAVISAFLSDAAYDDYDKLIQLCDSMASAEGVCLIDVRLLDVARRYGFNDFTLRKWDAVFSLKKYFDTLCGKNIYDLFFDEIRAVSFR